MRELIFIWFFTIIISPLLCYAQEEKGTYFSINQSFMLISEVLFDPEPVVGLPAYEYIELLNNGSDTINLGNWFLRVGDKKNALPSGLVPPGQYIILSGSSGAEEFTKLGLPALEVKWSALRNSGQYIALISPGGEIMHFMTYHPAQFENALKREGGWSLELADIENNCHTEAWLPSVNAKGGTPGRENSIETDAPFPSPPYPLRMGIEGGKKLILHLDKPVLPLTSAGWFDFSFEPSDLIINSWSYHNDLPWIVEILLNDSIPGDVRFTISVGGHATDCRGAGLIPACLEFGIPEKPDSGEVVISEIMFDPREDHPEFIGLHNVSDKILDLNSLYIATCNYDGVISSFSKPLDQSFLMFPGEEYAVTADESLLDIIENKSLGGKFCEREDFPALPNEGSAICLLDKNQSLLDKVRYEPDWHDQRLDETKGVSLERIRLDISGWFSSNWHSASVLCGGSTPGEVNTQASISHNQNVNFALENAAFCPDNDGSADFLLIRVSTDETGWIGNAAIWNLAGSCIKKLSAPGVLPTNALIKWDGNDELGNKVPPGYYLVILNYIRPDGSKGRWKEACVVTAY